MKIGYARVSTRSQNLDLQIKALEEAGCKQIFQEKISGAKTKRPQLQEMLKSLRSGDTVVVWKMSRLGRSLPHMISLFELFDREGIDLQTLSPPSTVDKSPTGRLIRNFFALLAEFQRDIIRENTIAGLEIARLNGRVGGRPRGLTDEAKKTAWKIFKLHDVADMSVREIMKFVEVSSTSTYYKYLNWAKEEAKRNA